MSTSFSSRLPNQQSIKGRLRRRWRRAVTLIEMMIVMFLIALIAGVVAFNYQASLEKGKAFKTEQGIEKIRTVLSIRLAEDDSALENMNEQWKSYLSDSPLVKNAEELSKDGWGQPYDVRVIMDGPSGFPEVQVTSTRYQQYKSKQGN